MPAFLRRLWHHSGVRYTFYTLAGIGLGVLVPYGLVTQAGEQRWERIHKQLQAEGETLDFFSLYPPPLPNEKNFCAIPPLDGIRTPKGNSPAAMAAELKRDAISAALKPLQKPVSKTDTLAPWATFPDLADSTPADLDRILAEAYEAGTLKLPTHGPRSWAAVRQALETHAPIIAEMARAAAERPAAEWLPRQTRETLPKSLVGLPMPEMNSAQQLSNLLRFHAVISIRAGDPTAALADVRAMLRVAEGTDRSLMAIGNLVSLTIRTQALQVTTRLLADRRLQDPQLATLQQEWEKTDIHGDYLRAVRSEIAAMINSFENLRKEPKAISTLTSTLPTPLKGWGIVEQVLLPASQAAAAEFMREFYLTPLKTQKLRGHFARMDQAQNTLMARTRWTELEWQVPQLFITTYFIIGEMTAHTENTRLQAVLACALERHHLRHGSYPATLQGIDAAFLAENDLADVDGAPMHYALSPDARYRLWSPGPDGKDDGGKYHTELPGGGRTTSSRHNPRYRGDWVWRYDPAPAPPADQSPKSKLPPLPGFKKSR